MISYQHIASATEFYAANGFKMIDVPWIVSDWAMNITRPAGAKTTRIDDGQLVASGEQGFLQLMLNNALPPGRWQCVTPCFRHDAPDRYHQRHFMKVELIDTLATTQESLEFITRISLRFFRSKLAGCFITPTDPVDSTLVSVTARDIVSPAGIELGSYGIRQHDSVGSWVYGTGCAEPRLSLAIEDTRPCS